MDARVAKITREIQASDPQLFAVREANGMISIYRKYTRYDVFDWEDGAKLFHSRPDKHHVLSLTHNWTVHGRPVPWGICPILAKLRAMDLWHRDIGQELLKEYDKRKASDERDFKNNTESFLLDFRRQFAKTFDGINTSTMEKIDKRRIHDGNYK